MSTLIKNVISACESNDPINTKTSLIRWGHVIWPDQPSLGIGDIANRTSPLLGSELIKLNQVLYSHTPQQWQGNDLKKIFADEAKKITPNNSRQSVEPGKLEPLFRIN